MRQAARSRGPTALETARISSTGHAVRGGRLGDPEALHRLGDGARVAARQLGGALGACR